MALGLRYAVRSDLGLVRGNNEDSVYAGPRLLAIADGMGGHAAGEVASKIVIGALEPLDDDRPTGDLIAALRNSVIEANHRISDAVERDKNLDGMGTTLTALRFAGSQVALVHVGDSRAYLLRGDLLSQITHDDTYVQYLVDSGKLTPDEAKDHPRKSVILRALRGADVEPDVSIREARAGDRYLLCTDGLSDVVSTETILETMRIPDAQESADRLVELALRGGGPDNVTVIVADVVEVQGGDAADAVPIVDGAFVDPAAADVPPDADSSPAERAARIGRPRPPAAVVAPPPKRRRWRGPLLALLVVALIFGGLGGTYAWAQTQYYVGRSGSEVAIYRGVNASFGPLKFSEVYENTNLKLSDLNPSARDQVVSGITARSRTDARRIVTRLHNQLQTPCRPATSPSPSPSPSGSSTGPSGSGLASSSPAGGGRTSPGNGGTASGTGSRSGGHVVASSRGAAPVNTAGRSVVGSPASAPRTAGQSSTAGGTDLPATGQPSPQPVGTAGGSSSAGTGSTTGGDC